MTEFTTRILWGASREPDDKPTTYTFDTQEKLDAFLEGVEAASGWMDYEVVDSSEKSFDVTLTETVSYTVRVVCADRSEAGQMARDIWVQSEDPFADFNGSAQDMSVDEVRELDE